MTAIRTTAAAEMLGVSASTLRAWERRYGFPTPRRTDGGHRQYDLGEIEALREAFEHASDAATAVALARREAGGGRFGSDDGGPTRPARPAPWDAEPDDRRPRPRDRGPVEDLRRALRRYDEGAAELVIEESLHVRSLERTVDELLLPAVDLVEGRGGHAADPVAHAFAWRWASRWLAAATRTAPPAHRPRTVLLLDGTEHGTLDALRVQALDLSLRRAGALPIGVGALLTPTDLERTLGRVEPSALVLSGRTLPLDRVGRLVFAAQRAAGGELAVLDFHGPLVAGRATGVERLDPAPLVARSRILRILQDDAPTFRVRRTAR